MPTWVGLWPGAIHLTALHLARARPAGPDDAAGDAGLGAGLAGRRGPRRDRLRRALVRAPPTRSRSTPRRSPGSRPGTGPATSLRLVNPLAGLTAWRPPPGAVGVVAVLLGSTAFDSFTNTSLVDPTVQSSAVPSAALGDRRAARHDPDRAGDLQPRPPRGWPATATGRPRDVRPADGRLARPDRRRLRRRALLHAARRRGPAGRGQPVRPARAAAGTSSAPRTWAVDSSIFDHPTAIAVVQLLAIVLGHVLGVVAAHEKAVRPAPGTFRAARPVADARADGRLHLRRAGAALLALTLCLASARVLAFCPDKAPGREGPPTMTSTTAAAATPAARRRRRPRLDGPGARPRVHPGRRSTTSTPRCGPSSSRSPTTPATTGWPGRWRRTGSPTCTPTGASSSPATTSTWSASPARTSSTATSRSRPREAGKHVWLEKPAGRNAEETARDRRGGRTRPACRRRSGFNYRNAPAVELARTARRRGPARSRRAGDDHDARRLRRAPGGRADLALPERSGPARACSATWSATGSTSAATSSARSDSLVCDTATFITERPALSGAAFAHTARGTGALAPVENEDYAGALLRFANGARGTLESSRVAVGEQCTYGIEVHGDAGRAGLGLPADGRAAGLPRPGGDRRGVRDPLRRPRRRRARRVPAGLGDRHELRRPQGRRGAPAGPLRSPRAARAARRSPTRCARPASSTRWPSPPASGAGSLCSDDVADVAMQGPAGLPNNGTVPGRCSGRADSEPVSSPHQAADRRQPARAPASERPTPF